MSDLGEISRVLGRMEGKIDTIIPILKTYDKRIRDNEKDIGRTNTKLGWYAGGATGLGALLGSITDIFRGLG